MKNSMSGNHTHAREAALSKELETFMRGEADRYAAEAMQPEEPESPTMFAIRLTLAIFLIGIGVAAVLSELIQ